MKNTFKKYTKKINPKYMYVFVIIAFFAVGFISLQAGYGSSSVWDIDVEFTGVTINGVYYAYADIPTDAYKAYRQISWDPDGNPVTYINMQATGLMPMYQLSLGAIFFTDEDGVPITSTSPRENYIDSEGQAHLIYYMGYSLSELTRGDHPSTVKYNFDYYNQILNTLYEVPEFKSGSVGAEVGIRLLKQDATIPTVVSVEEVSVLETRKIYTEASSLGAPDSIDEFNIAFSEWGTYYHKGSIYGGGEIDTTTTKLIVTDSNLYGAKVKTTSTLDPGSSYWIRRDAYGGWIAGGFNVYNVECITNYLVKLDISYNPAADVNKYLETRLDFILNRSDENFDLLYYLTLFLTWVMNIFGLSDIWLAAIVVIIMFIIFIIFLIFLKKALFNRAKTRMMLYAG